MQRAFRRPLEAIEQRELERLRWRAQGAHRVDFFRKRWDEAGIHPDPLRSLEALWRAPTCTVDDLRQSLETEPGERLPEGEQRCICVTGIYRTGSPQFRYNILDLSFLYPREPIAAEAG